MKVLVDGAAGFLGRHVVEALLRRGLAVRATDRAPMPAWPGVERVERDLAEGSLRPLFEGVTHVVHVAGLFDLSAPRETLFANNEGVTRRVARAAALAGVERFVHVSSVTVYGRPTAVPVREDAPIRPSNAYERSKAAGERALLEVGLPSVVLRPSGIYGPHGRYGLATVIASLALAKAKEGKGQRSVRGGARMTHVHVEDVAEAAAHLVTAEGVIGRAFNVADGHAVAWGELMAALERELGLDETRPIVLTPAKARWLGRAAALMSRRTRRANARLEAAWRRLCAERGLVPALCPRIDASAYDYASADHVYACDALEATGWRARHRDVLAGLRDTFARYPLVVDPLVATEEAVLTAPDGAPHDYFGSSVALSADGSVALVGAFWDATSVAATGSARVFVRTETGWVEEATLVAPDGAVGDEFGWSVALSADGKVALVGAPGDDMAAGTNVGSAHVFVRTESGDWVHEAMLVARDGAEGGDFGFSVALSADGKVALVGAYADDVAADRNVGSARVFVRTDSGDWVEEAMLVARDGAEGGDFGFSVALSADGKVALVGAYADDTPASEEAGSARVFVRTETGDWVEEAMLAAPDGAADDWFGRSVALSADGRVALVGAERDDTPAGEDAGSARVFVRTERETGSRRRCWSRPTVRRGASSAVRSR